MTTLREAAQQALEALEYRDGDGADQWKADVITALRAALAQEQADPVQEPVAWLYEAGTDRTLHWHKPPLCGTPLYTAPPQRQPLTELERTDLSRCPQCGGIADNGHDRSIPPNPYLCTKCMAEPVAGIIEPRIEVDSHQTLDEAMRLPRAMAQAYERGYKAGAAAERERIIQFLQEMQRQVGDGHNHYGVAAMRIRERV